MPGYEVHEYEQYVRAKQELPKKGKAVMTPYGEGVVVEVQVPAGFLRLQITGLGY